MDAVKKLQSISEISKIIRNLRKGGKTIGLITGCFDIFHIDHMTLFKFAKKHVDVLVVGLDNDDTIQLSKGKDRPIFNFRQRERVLSGLSSVEYIFLIKDKVKFGITMDNIYQKNLEKLRPDFVITNPFCDKFWKRKKIFMKNIGAKILLDKRKVITSSSKIIKKLKSRI